MPIVFQINVTANWGSTGKIAEQIGHYAQSAGWESYVAYGRYSNPSTSSLIKIGKKVDIYSHYLLQRLFDNEGLNSILATKELIRKIKRIKPDIVHLHNLHDHYVNYRLLFSYLNSTAIKVVWTMHDFWAVTGHCMHFVSVGCNRYQTECDKCPMRTVYPKSLIDRSKFNHRLKRNLFLGKKDLTVVAVSRWVEGRLKESFLKDKSIRTIENGVDLSIFRPTEDFQLNRKYDGKFIIMAVASQWNFDKGLDDYMRLSSLLQDDEIIILVGVDSNIMTRLPHNIIGIEHTNNLQELVNLYSRANVVTIFSSAETFGLTVVEGFACGTPAVVYDNTAPPHLITPGTGFVVENKNVVAAYNAIQKIKKAGKEKYSSHCQELAREKYDNKKQSQLYIKLYEELLSGS